MPSVSEAHVVQAGVHVLMLSALVAAFSTEVSIAETVELVWVGIDLGIVVDVVRRDSQESSRWEVLTIGECITLGVSDATLHEH